MSSSNRKIVNIGQHAEQKVLSKNQKQFNNLIKKIETQKKLLREWQELMPDYQKKVQEDYQPLREKVSDQQIAFVRLLDKAYDDSLFKKRDKEKLTHIVLEVIEDLTAERGDEIKDLYNKYRQSDFDADREEQESLEQELFKSMAQSVLNIEVPDDLDLKSPEKLQAFMREQLEAKMLDEERRNEERQSKRKKTAKQLEKEAKQKEQEQAVSQSIQEVYRKLVKALHPDRERDEAERLRKTELMQRVNLAYGKKDLLQLLELQLETEQIDQEHVNNISEERLKHFIMILKEQLSELTHEIEGIEFGVKVNLAMAPYERLAPNIMMNMLQQDINQLKKLSQNISDDLAFFMDFQNLKRWLKDYRIPKTSTHETFDDLFADFDPRFF